MKLFAPFAHHFNDLDIAIRILGSKLSMTHAELSFLGPLILNKANLYILHQ